MKNPRVGVGPDPMDAGGGGGRKKKKNNEIRKYENYFHLANKQKKKTRNSLLLKID